MYVCKNRVEHVVSWRVQRGAMANQGERKRGIERTVDLHSYVDLSIYIYMYIYIYIYIIYIYMCIYIYKVTGFIEKTDQR